MPTLTLKDAEMLLLNNQENPPVSLTVAGPCAEIEFKNGDVLKFSRDHGGTADWFTIKLNNTIVHQG